jgi:hypothetical protein
MLKPFIYIAALRRTGSKVLSEALSLAPHSFIFLEPKLGSGVFKAKPVEVEVFKKHGIDLPAFQKQLSEAKSKYAVEYFKEKILPELLKVFKQIGIKEIHHKHWRNVYNAFPNMKVILTARDPRDIYLSLYHKSVERKKEINVGGLFTPKNLALNLKEDFEYQMEMFNTTACLKVKYEDFCADSKVLEQIKKFVESDIPEIGMIGQLSKFDHLVHGYQITDKRVYRWKSEPDKRLLAEAQEVFDNLKDYCKFWDYKK